MRRNWWLKIALVVCLSASVLSACDSEKKKDTDVMIEEEAGPSSVTVADQTADPINQVVIAEVVAGQDSFIAIHEDDGSGGIGGVIGVSALIPKGTAMDLTVTLDRDAVNGETLYAMLHSDSNGNGAYEFPADGLDGPVVDEAGDVIAPPFTVTVEGDMVIEPSVTVMDQTADPANQVVVDAVTTPTDGFIAIHEDDGSGGIGGVIGVSALLTQGDNSDITITLDRDAVDGETLYAMLHSDSNGNGAYEFPTDGLDGPALDADGNVVAPGFTVTVEGDMPALPEVTVMDQTADPANEVLIDEVISPVDGFIAIHEDDGDGGIGGVIGVSALLEAGTTTGIVVTLDRDAVDGETLYAMLHSDSNGNGVYEFPTDGLDGPVLLPNDAIVAPAFTVSVGAVENNNAVTVANQTADPANMVVIAEVSNDVDGFIVIHEGDGNGGIGGVIGNSALLEAGTHIDVPVTLSRDAVDGETLYAMLHSDSNGNGAYEFPTDGLDGPALDGEGNVVAPGFTVSVGAVEDTNAVTVMDQTADPANTVLIAGVITEADGFVVIHEDNGEGGIGGVIGSSALLEAGTHSDVTITLDRDAVDGETLYAMLHSDSNSNGVYEFPTDGLDGPVLDGDGVVIAPPFTVTVEAMIGESSVVVESQVANPANRVTVAQVNTAVNGFIAVHEDNGEGGIGAVIGVSGLLEAGTHSDVTVALDQSVTDGKLLFAMLHEDVDGNGFYNFPGPDGPVLDGQGVVIAPPFYAFLAEFVDFVAAADQTAEPANMVSIPTVATVADGFIVIHEDNGEGGIGGVIGNSALLEAGVHSHVPVTLNRDAIHNETLYAMLHTDSNSNGVYEFPTDGLDGPVLDGDGVVIAPPFVVGLNLVDGVTAENQDASEFPDQVVIAQVTNSANGFIAIHEDNGEGGIGGVIGVSAFLPEGMHTDVPVTLERNANDGETLYAMLHVDGDDNGVYEFPMVAEDGPVFDGNGDVIAPGFEVTVANQVHVMDQLPGGTLLANTVVVSEVIYNGGGFIAIHEDNGEGGIGGVIGVSNYLPMGTNSEVVITVDRLLLGGETLYAMLHMDADSDTVYTFPGPDGPVLDGEGVVIAPPFMVLSPL